MDTTEKTEHMLMVTIEAVQIQALETTGVQKGITTLKLAKKGTKQRKNNPFKLPANNPYRS